MVNKNLAITVIIILLVLGLFNAISFLSSTNRPKEPIKPTRDEINNKKKDIIKRIEDEKDIQDTISIDSAIRVLGW